MGADPYAFATLDLHNAAQMLAHGNTAALIAGKTGFDPAANRKRQAVYEDGVTAHFTAGVVKGGADDGPMGKGKTRLIRAGLINVAMVGML